MLESAGCGDPCGWIAAVIAALTYGSYGVPIKATSEVEVHPLVLQSYKTFTLFIMSFYVLFAGEEAKWTAYGIISGFLWVMGGTCGIVGIRNAGMAVAVGTWASVMVLVNFVWGILVFREPISSFPHTCMAFLTLCFGLVGMSKYSAVPKSPAVARNNRDEVELVESRFNKDNDGLIVRRRADDEEVVSMLPQKDGRDSRSEYNEDAEAKKPVDIVIAGTSFNQREFGILCSVFNGISSGSSLIPMHFAKKYGFMGQSYILSFGSGSLLANVCIWSLYFGYAYIKGSKGTTLRTTFDLMPPFQWKYLWLKGFLAGFLLTIGMFGAIFAITFLGQGVGNSLVQAKILISGLWGIFWFKEVKDSEAIVKWFASATVCVASILWLSYERSSATSKG